MKKNKKIQKLSKVLKNNFNQLKIKKYKNAFIASDLSCLRKLRINKEKLLETIFLSLKKSLNYKSTIFVPTGNLSLCNSEIVFDLKNTPSKDMGSFSEYIRKKKNTVRSLHPYWSVSANGEKAKLLKDVSKHSYGIGSPWSIMLELDTVQINIGKKPGRAVTLIHHLETICGVPYRFNKQFYHKIKLGKKIIKQDFYMSVFFKKINIEKRKKLNEHYFKELKKRNQIKEVKNEFGLTIWSFKMRDFYSLVNEKMKKNIFNYLEFKPDLKDLDNI